MHDTMWYFLVLHPQCTVFRMVSGAGWVLGHPGDAKIILLHHVPSMSHWTRWVYGRLLSFSTLILLVGSYDL